MRIINKNTGNVFDVDIKGSRVEERYICPECSHTRSKPKDKCFSWNNDKNTGKCHNCEGNFYKYHIKKQKEYTIPEWKNKTKLTDRAVKWFNSRMISQKSLNKMRVYSDNEFMPEFENEVEVICFPYFRGEKLINIKFRGQDKSFKLVSNAELLFWNENVINDNEKIVIVEGEIDLLTFIENGFDNVISVPNGANNKLEFLDNAINLFDNIKEIFIAVDNDSKGMELRDELIRRLGVERCFIMDFEDCKDPNEYFCKYGGIKFKDIKYHKAPVKGIIYVDDFLDDIQKYVDDGIKPGLCINQSVIDDFALWETGWIVIVSGIPASGKSEFIDYIVSKLNILYGWKAAFFTPENYPLIFHFNKLFKKIYGNKINKANYETIITVKNYIHDNFCYILDEEDLTIDNILDKAKYLVKTRGIKMLIIDPYNTIDHKYDSNTTETKYISLFLKKLQLFARFYDVLVFLIAHPTKMQNGEIPSLYSISGSAHFFNKADYGIIVHRISDEKNIMTNEINVFWKKIRFQHLGKQGVSELKYNFNNGRYEDKKLHSDLFDNSNWLL